MITSDFRSDTLTLPSPAMRQAMAEALVGDDVLDGDPTVGELERRIADWLGKEGALFVPSGTMANQVALGAWTRPGDEFIVQRFAHITTHEAGAAGYLHGLQAMTVGDSSGVMPVDEVRAALRPVSIHVPRTALITFEQTHNMAGGRVAPLDEWRALRELAAAVDIPIHLDGARLANAVVASGIAAREWAAGASSVSVCLSKGLGAPVGSVVAGDADFIERGRLVRKRLGGWMRQAGILAAAGLYALDHNLERLADDHALARRLAEGASAIEGLAIDPDDVHTNIVMLTVDAKLGDAEGLVAALAREGVAALAMGVQLVRFTLHMGLGSDDVERALQALAKVVARASASPA